MALDPRSVAVEGVGFGPEILAVVGLSGAASGDANATGDIGVVYCFQPEAVAVGGSAFVGSGGRVMHRRVAVHAQASGALGIIFASPPLAYAVGEVVVAPLEAAVAEPDDVAELAVIVAVDAFAVGGLGALTAAAPAGVAHGARLTALAAPTAVATGVEVPRDRVRLARGAERATGRLASREAVLRRRRAA